MKEQGLVALCPKKFIPRTTKTDPSMRRSPNLLLNRKSIVEAPNEVVVGDITYLHSVKDGIKSWLYLAVWIDIFSRKIVGWKVAQQMKDGLVIDALKQVIRSRQPPQGLIVHSDGGGQYASHSFRAILDVHGFQQSMTRKDNHYDNALVESLFGRLKTELEAKTFYGLEDARMQIFEYIEMYYNTIRKHSSIGYKSPNQFEKLYTMGLSGNECFSTPNSFENVSL
jgi:transposase InsO family protein